MKELKKEFEEKFVEKVRNNTEYDGDYLMGEPEELWQWFESKLSSLEKQAKSSIIKLIDGKKLEYDKALSTTPSSTLKTYYDGKIQVLSELKQEIECQSEK